MLEGLLARFGGRFVEAGQHDGIADDFFPQIGPDGAPRFSAAYDVFGNGKTALKTSFNRYYSTFGFTFLIPLYDYAPAGDRSEDREWFDVTLMPGTDIPMGPGGCETTGTCTNPYGTDGDNIPQNWEIGVPGNALFSTGADRVICLDGATPFGGNFTCQQDWQRKGEDLWTVALQQEIMPGVSVNFEWRRRWVREPAGQAFVHRGFTYVGDPTVDGSAGYYNGAVVDNGVWFLEHTVQAPLPYTRTIPVYGILPSEEAKSGSVDATIPESAGFRDRYTGFEVGINARLPNGGMIFGAWTAEVPGGSEFSGILNTCGSTVFEADNPVGFAGFNSLTFCDQFAYPRQWQHEFKLAGAYPLPWWQLQLAGSLQAYPGSGGVFTPMAEYWTFCRSTFCGSAFSNYDARFYNDSNCISPCVIGGYYNTAVSPFFDFILGPQVAKQICFTLGTCATGQFGTGETATFAMIPQSSVKTPPYFTQLDLSVARIFNFGGTRVDTRFEVFNLFNSGTILATTGASGNYYGWQGSTFENATSITTGRVLRLSMTARF